ncbi:PREDICTED: LOW QUALITY PROTEIN: uncharacterized protein LOC105545326 [Mandrillus leucophaeus]|uniref:LOW QUALITY PROTEIN: uncharacterized protein LOC105545326 n=1 Tax=Mandrillus leucophaeus TaxID=9568 RepID=UPI0005F430BC|nr:PREDICTED: LOW QUALITY PROTEIN: uncharacterized protein LOC105545326 [Mandrillus leucophaeus]
MGRDQTRRGGRGGVNELSGGRLAQAGVRSTAGGEREALASRARGQGGPHGRRRSRDRCLSVRAGDEARSPVGVDVPTSCRRPGRQVRRTCRVGHDMVRCDGEDRRGASGLPEHPRLVGLRQKNGATQLKPGPLNPDTKPSSWNRTRCTLQPLHYLTQESAPEGEHQRSFRKPPAPRAPCPHPTHVSLFAGEARGTRPHQPNTKDAIGPAAPAAPTPHQRLHLHGHPLRRTVDHQPPRHPRAELLQRDDPVPTTSLFFFFILLSLCF